MLLNVVLCLVERLEFLEMCKRFRMSTKLVIDLELPPDIGQILKRLEVRKILSRVLNES